MTHLRTLTCSALLSSLMVVACGSSSTNGGGGISGGGGGTSGGVGGKTGSTGGAAGGSAGGSSGSGTCLPEALACCNRATAANETACTQAYQLLSAFGETLCALGLAELETAYCP